MYNSYDAGFAAGKSDALNFFPPSGSRLWKRPYRDGYSDGYYAFRANKGAKQW